ncbi:hypothetical protein [Cryobacterium sp. PH31-L1]|uniref:hypothetical protein n=1 Tax=Cryobacterium sp. PH31-L1 TaxID=3046199 RepID=UPI0024BBDEE8|nr:hypothetical protein [Cryobacterium sp. PH31-L1]MDJ0378304.1 hypothetical protein [Cryobacterium sp. PH31-L1]
MLRLALELAVQHEVLPRNPMHHVARLCREPHVPNAHTAPEGNVIRAAIAHWESVANHISGPKPDGELGAIIEVMLGTSARIGEVLAIRRRDIDITGAVPSIRLTGTIVSRNGELPSGKTIPKPLRLPVLWHNRHHQKPPRRLHTTARSTHSRRCLTGTAPRNSSRTLPSEKDFMPSGYGDGRCGSVRRSSRSSVVIAPGRTITLRAVRE